MHDLNLVLKARQLGFSTLILLLALDGALFTPGFSAGLLADTQVNADNLLARVKFAYDNLPKSIRDGAPLVANSARKISFTNGSEIETGVSLRSSTRNFLHVSEYGPLAVARPDRAEEIKTGALNTMSGGTAFIESTAAGRSGDFFDRCERARALEDAGTPLTSMDWKFHFHPWFQDPGYRLDGNGRITAEDQEYFDALRDAHGIELDPAQMAWYAAKKRDQGDGMMKEFPSTPDEAFASVRDGSYFGKIISGLRQLGEIGEFPLDPRIPCVTGWDLGRRDYTSIVIAQEIAGRACIVGFHENTGEGIGYYVNWLNTWRARHGAVWDRHMLPHDAAHQGVGMDVSVKSQVENLGLAVEIVARTASKVNSIENARTMLHQCRFHEPATARLIEHLEAYTKSWDAALGVWKPEPRHDEHSHAADAFRTLAEGWQWGEEDEAAVPKWQPRNHA